MFGSPTYMGTASGAFHVFAEATSKRWAEQAWTDKLAAGFTNSASESGDKLHTLQFFQILAAQLGMHWINLGLLPGWNNSAGSEAEHLGRRVAETAKVFARGRPWPPEPRRNERARPTVPAVACPSSRPLGGGALGVGVWDGPFYRVRRDGYEICFVVGVGEELDEVTDVDMWVTFADQQRWSGTVFTLDEARRLMDRWKDTGENLGGRYFYGWDNLIVRDSGIPAMVHVIDHLVATGDYRSALRPIGVAED